MLVGVKPLVMEKTGYMDMLKAGGEAMKSDIDNLGESIEDTLMDLASYSIMTLMELNKQKRKQ